MNYGLRLTPKMITDLAEGYQQGKTTTELALQFNISKATICRALRKMGIEPERKDDLFTTKDLTQEEITNILLDFRAGLKIKNLSNKYGHSYSIIVKLLEDNNLYNKKAINKPTDDITKVVKISDNTVKHILGNADQLELCKKFVDGPQAKMELAVEYSIHVDTVTAILRRHDALIKRHIPDEILDMICADYEAGMTLYKISTNYNQSPQTLKYWLTKRGFLDTLKVDESGAPVLADSKKKWTKAQFREWAQSNTAETAEILLDIARDPQSGVRNRIQAIALMHERAHGKPKEEVEETRDNQSAAEKILKMIK